MQTENFPLDKIIPYARNPRKNEAAIAKVAASLKEYGWQQPIVVDPEMVVIAGHTRLEAARSLGMTDAPVHIATNLSPAQAKAYRIADNRSGQEAEWDFDMLAIELKDLDDDGFDLALTFFDDDELAKLMEPEQVDGLTDEDAVPEVPEAPTSVLGDVWLLGNHRVMCGDSTSIDAVEKLMDGQKADMVFTDPPYGISFTDSKGGTIKNDDLNDEKMAEFNKLWQSNADIASKGDCFLLAWQSPRKFHLLDYHGAWSFFRLITMYKSNRISFPHGAWINKTEPCCVFSKGQPRITKQEYMDDCYVYKHDKESHEDSNVGHPTPKPVKMVASNITACAKKDDIVLDLFGGSGSALIACEKTDRINRSMELDPKYVDVIIKRWQDFTGNTATLEGDGRTFSDVAAARE